MTTHRALIADDEPLLREHLATHLARQWPELQIVGEARNGREAVELFDQLRPDVVFLDVHMPGISGVDAARTIGPLAQIVFVTAFEQYAVQAFEQGAIDYVVKPLDETRLAATVSRLKERLADRAARRSDDTQLDAALEQLALRLSRHATPLPRLQWIRASVGSTVKLIPVDQVTYLRSDEKYTLVVWEGGEALIRKPIRELIDELDPEQFVQVHRSVIVNLRQVAQVTRGANETAESTCAAAPKRYTGEPQLPAPVQADVAGWLLPATSGSSARFYVNEPCPDVCGKLARSTERDF
jgi:DNA-binding LytR/AlgR family response regulator